MESELTLPVVRLVAVARRLAVILPTLHMFLRRPIQVILLLHLLCLRSIRNILVINPLLPAILLLLPCPGLRSSSMVVSLELHHRRKCCDLCSSTGAHRQDIPPRLNHRDPSSNLETLRQTVLRRLSLLALVSLSMAVSTDNHLCL